jgi:hypothetical protein
VAANAFVVGVGTYYGGGAVADSGYTAAFSELTHSNSYHFVEKIDDAGGAGTETLTFGLSGSRSAWSLAIASYVAGGGSSPTVSGTSTATPANGASLTINGSNFGATQGAGSVTIGGISQTVTTWSDTSIVVTVARGTNKYGVAVNIVVTDNALVSSAPFALGSIQPQSGWAFVNLTAPSTTVANRLQATPDLASGDQIAYNTVGGLVTVAADASFTAANTVTSFQFEVWTTDGWGATATQFIAAQWYPPALAGDYDLASKYAAFKALLDPQTWFGPVGVAKWFADDLAETVGSGPVEVFGTLSVSLAPVTLSSAGSASVNGSLARTLAAVTLSGTGSVSVAGTLNATLAAVTASASGTVANAGTLNATLAAATVSASGAVSNTGTLNATLGAVTLSASGTVGNGVTGTLSQTLGAVTLSSAGTVNVSGTLNQTLGAVTASASGSVSVTGTLSSTLAAVTLSATGSSGNTATGTLNATLGTLTASSSGSVSITGTLNRTLANVTLVSAGSVLVTGNLNVTLGPVTLFTGGIPDTWSGGSSRIGGANLYNQSGRIGATVMASQQGRIGR